MGRPSRLGTDQERTRFLRILRECWGIRRRACKQCGISYSAFLFEYDRNETFRHQVLEAELDANEDLEVAAHTIAIAGDGPMLRFLLATRMPEKYSRDRGALTINANAPLPQITFEVVDERRPEELRLESREPT
jgi:hypothetical protein